jgi:ABC-type nitrate/sulfonate/bicarbonate transport system substrate-binding protein
MKYVRPFAILIALFVAAAEPAGAQTSPVLRLACFPTDSYGEAYYAQDMGFFKEHGISVEFVVNNAGAVALAALAGNGVDIGVANPVSIAQAYVKGVPISVFAGGGLYTATSPATLLVVPKNSPLQKPKDLEGKTIGLPGLGDQLQAATIVWLQKNGADPAKVKFIELNPPTVILGALAQGRVDAATPPEPIMTQSLQSDARIFGDPFAAIAPRFFIGLWVARTDWLKANPEVARRFADAIYEAARWANTHHDESAAILAKYAKADPAAFRTMRRATFSDSALDPRLIQPILDAGTQTGMLSTAVKAADMVTKGF